MGIDGEWMFDEVRSIYGDDKQCPVCGHPTGNCVPADHSPPDKIFGLGLFQSLDVKQMFTVEEDVYEDYEFVAGHTVRICTYRKGQQIPLVEAREKGLTTL